MPQNNLQSHKFWSSQPVCEPEKSIELNQPIDEKDLSQTPKDPIRLPTGFKWIKVDINDSKQLSELFEFLRDNYVEDPDSTFRLIYSRDILKWALMPPDILLDANIGIRNESSGQLVAFISAVPDTFIIRGKTVKLVIVDFLCVHKTYRSKRLSPVLIKEITRIANLHGIAQAFHTGSIALPTCISSPTYLHRFLNPKKLLDCEFCYKADNMKLSFYLRLHKTPQNICTVGIRKMVKQDANQVTELLNNFQKQFLLAKVFTKEYVEKCLVYNKDIIYSYVVEKNNIITDFISFYALTCNSIKMSSDDPLKIAMMFYYAFTDTPFENLVNDLTYYAKTEGFDVINALDVMHTLKLKESLKFIQGSGILRCYLYNWKCAPFERPEIGVLII